MKFLVIALLAVAVLPGCGRKEPSASTPTADKPQAVSISDTSANPPPGGDSIPQPDAATAAAPDAGSGDVDPATKAAIQKYISKKGTPPRSWIDLTTEQGYLDKIPTGKDGKPLNFDKAMARLNIKVP